MLRYSVRSELKKSKYELATDDDSGKNGLDNCYLVTMTMLSPSGKKVPISKEISFSPFLVGVSARMDFDDWTEEITGRIRLNRSYIIPYANIRVSRVLPAVVLSPLFL
jgi:hypothetical protein